MSLAFRFAFVHDGKAEFFKKDGDVRHDGVVLAGDTLPVAHIEQVLIRDNRLVVAAHEAGRGVFVIEITGGKAAEVKRAIDHLVSEYRGLEHKRQLEGAGNGHVYRAVQCPVCRSLVDFSGVKTKHAYCRYCESVFREGTVVTGPDHHLCDECGLFGRIQQYTEFYFYFALVVYGFSYKRKFLCDGCAKSTALKAFLLNFIFLLGIIPALWMRIKASLGRKPELAELPKANALIKAGRREQASVVYKRMQSVVGGHPGLFYNEGRYSDALATCSNYLPAMRDSYSAGHSR